MYQFSLEAYNSLFNLSLANSAKHDNLAERIKALNSYHTYAVYKYAARALFERHKLLLSLQVRWQGRSGGCCAGLCHVHGELVAP
jgi:dynein heavy chain